jgi:5-methyltetrahydrofolate corrinoid/iron sulfur protein methyltransferase
MPKPIPELALACRDAGARAIDINSGPLSRRPEEKMTFLVDTVRRPSTCRIVLDTTNPRAMAAGLAACRNRATINGVSLEPDKQKQILPLARQYDCDLIGYLLRPDGQVPADAAGRMEAAVALFEALDCAGIRPESILTTKHLISIKKAHFVVDFSHCM